MQYLTGTTAQVEIMMALEEKFELTLDEEGELDAFAEHKCLPTAFNAKLFVNDHCFYDHVDTLSIISVSSHHCNAT